MPNRMRFFAWHLAKTIYSGPMYRIGDLFDLADSAVARVSVAVAAILTVLALGLDASGWLDLTGLAETFPLLALGGAVLGSMSVGATVAAWIPAERTEGEPRVQRAEVARAPQSTDRLPVEPSPESRPGFCERIYAGRLVTEETRSRGDF
ncbi:hypothetical protein [Frigoriglobus tundricola]|uniref:Uncharacterized protein n=1 Tax=Frigoriglobus tundricola TaxID=2774151 RepID=A0A6M5YPW8_9BACT|nr:hypothetical protein [Frigoriglobus tundricola]QJW95396.1 hypothetical protein FTUN_2945 [Frigoriglobus tundricola]